MDELKQKIEALRARINELRAGERTIDAAREIIAARAELDAAMSEAAEFEAAEVALAAMDALDAEAEGGEAEGGEAEGAEDDGGEAEGDDGGEAEGDDGGEAEVADPEAERVLVTASAAEEEGSVSPTAGDATPLITLTASAGTGGVQSGSTLDRNGILAMLKSTLTASASEVSRTRLFSVNTHRPDAEVVSLSRSAFENSRILKEAGERAQSSLPLTAAACFCGPDRVETAIEAIGDTDRPVAGLFPSVPVDGGFRYVPDLSINPDSGSINTWTCTDQGLVDPNDPNTWKQCSELDCFSEVTVEPYMVTGCTIVRRQHQFAHPEQVNAWLDKLRVEYARKAEVRLLDAIEADAGAPLTVGAGAGTMAAHGLLSKVLYALGSVGYAMGYEFRSTSLEGRTVIVPRGFLNALLADEHLRGFNHNKTKAELISKLRNDYGINLVERKDESTARTAAAVAAVAALNAGGAIDASPTVVAPPSWRMYVVDPSQYRRGEGQLVGADWHVDTALLRQNKLLYFWENLEFLELMGPKKPHVVDITGCINGARSDLVAPPAC